MVWMKIKICTLRPDELKTAVYYIGFKRYLKIYMNSSVRKDRVECSDIFTRSRLGLMFATLLGTPNNRKWIGKPSPGDK